MKHPSGDHLTLLVAYNSFKNHEDDKDWVKEHYLNTRTLKSAEDVRKQLLNLITKMEIKVPQSNNYDIEFTPRKVEKIIKCIIEGYFSHVAHKEPQGFYKTVKDHQIVLIHPSSVLDEKPIWVLYHEFVLTNQNYIRTVTKLNGKWLLEMNSNKLNNYFILNLLIFLQYNL